MKKFLTQHLKIIAENSIDCISKEELARKLALAFKEQRPLKIKIGFDPTTGDIHLGHTVLLRKLRQVQDLGHTVYLIIGDFTARIGDPSGRSELRPMLKESEINDNARTYTSQAFKILDKRRTRVVFNSRWYKDMPVSDFINLLSRYTIARMLERNDFSKRIKQNKPLTLGELIYPIIQGYDSVKIKADIEFGGSDQKFNLIVARHLQESFGQKPQVVITLPLLVGLDGKNKMSKSLGNYIGITENSRSMFGKLMSIPDNLMVEYFKLLTDVDIEKIKSVHPKEAKLLLAQTIVELYYSHDAAQKERAEFERIFSKGGVPHKLPVCVVRKKSIDIIELLYRNKCAASKNEARRLLAQHGISCNGQVIDSTSLDIPSGGAVLKVGKRRFIKIIYKSY